VIGLLVACTPRYGAVPKLTTRVEVPELRARFATVMWGEVWNQELELDVRAQILMDQVVNHAVAAVDRGPAAPNAIPDAEQVLRSFVQQLARTHKSTRSETVGEGSVRALLSRICPIYPLC
jgi:hypothetical protein